MDEMDIPYLWLHYATEQNYRLFRAIKDEYYYLEEALQDVRKGQMSRFPKLKEEIAARLKQASSPAFLERYSSWLDRTGVHIVAYDNYAFPSLLKQIPDPPTLLFYKGRLETDTELSIALVGTRHCTDYGKETARMFGKALAKAGATVVTGLATGIDAYGALGALDEKEADYPVIGVLGCGIDVVYPKGNEKLYASVAERGALVTEFLPKTAPMPYNFPFRNRIISGLSHGTLVVEAGEKSGASITASCALEQGREVFAVPGRVSDTMSVGTNRMIRRGEAKLVCTVGDILEEFGMTGEEEEKKQVLFKELSEAERNIITVLSQGEKNEDELMDATGCGIGETISTLTAMTFAGLVKELPGGMYALDTFSVNIVY